MTPMMDRWISPVKVNEIGRDALDGRYVLVTNGDCVLDHSTQDAYQKAHAATGCQFRPCEGLVFEMDGTLLVSWSMENVRDRELVPCNGASVRKQYEWRLEQIAKERKKKEKTK